MALSSRLVFCMGPLVVVVLALLLFMPSALEAAAASSGGTTSDNNVVFSLDRYGARGDGTHDDTPALAKAWNAACSSSRPAVVLVPGGGNNKRYLLKQPVVTLSGPCKSPSVTVAVQGTLVASPDRSDWSDEDRRHWIVFRGVDGLTVNGGGTIGGNGETWWTHSCKTNKALVSVVRARRATLFFCWKLCTDLVAHQLPFFPERTFQPCKEAPTALSFHHCTNLRVESLKIVNSQQIHMSVEDCTGVQLEGLSITAPGTSPNTDGIHITRSKDVEVTNCKIKTGN